MRVIGMISGTSFDAIEAAAVDFDLEGTVVSAVLGRHVSVPYDDGVRRRIAAMLPPGATTIDEVCQLDTLIGQAFAEVADELARATWSASADVVCSHGQTVFHWVKDGVALGTLQLGQAAWIAERTGATVITDVRSRDIAAGGQGAPLASLVDVLLLGAHPTSIRGALNLGGISNVTVVGPDRESLAFDIGPANALLDAVVAWRSDGRATFDVDGRGASRGHVNDELLADLLDEPYYAASPPKSTGKELFHLGYVQRVLGSRSLADDDLLATLTALSAETVARAVRDLEVSELFVSGGGTHNPVLMAAIAERIPGVRLAAYDQLGVPEAAKEAFLFALIGFLTMHDLAGTVASCTGARQSTVLGAVLPGRQPMVKAPTAPTSLLVRGTATLGGTT